MREVGSRGNGGRRGVRGGKEVVDRLDDRKVGLRRGRVTEVGWKGGMVIER